MMGRSLFVDAGLAQLVEQLICNQQVAGSSPIASSILKRMDRIESESVELDSVCYER
jgi:hypothetical protein